MKIKLKEFEFSEYEGESQFWKLHKSRFSNINLIVGRNASGKTRTLNVLKSLSYLLNGRRTTPFTSGEWTGMFDINNNKSYEYYVKYKDKHVFREYLKINNSKEYLLDRNKSGKGHLYGEKIKKNIEFQIDENVLAAYSRSDQIQHSYLSNLTTWAKSVIHFSFGSDLGQGYVSKIDGLVSEQDLSNIPDVNLTVDRLRIGIEKYKDKYKKLIIEDFNKIGYEITDVGVALTGEIKIVGMPALVLYVKEKDLEKNTAQMQMSQGMFRALSLLININYLIVGGHNLTILIDDIGEGLDYQRSSELIQVLINKAKKYDYQLFMTTNDKFVMNKIPIEYWSIISRDRNRVSLINYYNSKEIFDDFKYIGLSNFEFFESNLFLNKPSDSITIKKKVKMKATKKTTKKAKKKAKKKTTKKVNK